ncbi:MAG: 2-dehydropantoate 2-reductase [Chitinophagaceae bacterium]
MATQKEEIIHPAIVTSKPEQTGFVDLIICSIKNYDLETSIESIKTCISNKTIILPLLNGVDASDRIKKMVPQAEVWEGCIYIVSRLIAPGVIKESGNINSLYFGSAQAPKEKLQQVETIFKSANINTHLSENILQTLWEKFLFISPLATLTSYLNLCVGDILSNKQHEALLMNLLAELKNIADAKSINLSENIIQKIVDKVKTLSPETTSSMHSDFKKGNKTEVDSLTAYVVREGNELNIPTPYYSKIFLELKKQ